MNHRFCYWVNIPPVEVSDVCDIIQFVPVTDTTTERVTRVLTLILNQVNNPGPADDENLEVAWVRGHTTAGTGGTVAPMTAVLAKGQGSRTAAKTFTSAVASGGQSQQGPKHVLSVRAGIERPYLDQEIFEAEGILVLRLLTTPDIPYTLTGSVLVEEYTKN